MVYFEGCLVLDSPPEKNSQPPLNRLLYHDKTAPKQHKTGPRTVAVAQQNDYMK